VRFAWIAVELVGLAVMVLGALWFLQGAGVVHVEPVACVSSCGPVTGSRPAWQVAGAVAVAIGALVTFLADRNRRRTRKR
jgi:hypothetical protein